VFECGKVVGFLKTKKIAVNDLCIGKYINRIIHFCVFDVLMIILILPVKFEVSSFAIEIHRLMIVDGQN
jgi:hypothetical protein